MDVYTILGGFFGIVGIFIFYKVYDMLANKNPFALIFFGVKKLKMVMLYPMEHKVMWEDKIYDVLIAGDKAYIPELKREITKYVHRPNTNVIMGYRLDNATIVDPYFMGISIPVIYTEEFRKLIGDDQFNKLDLMVKGKFGREAKRIGPDGKETVEVMAPDMSLLEGKKLPVALVAAAGDYSGLLSVHRDRAKIEAQKHANATPETLKEKIIGAAPFILIVMAMVFLFMMISMNAFSAQSSANAIYTKPWDANLACQSSLSTCQQGLIDVLHGKNVTLPNGTANGGIFDVFN